MKTIKHLSILLSTTILMFGSLAFADGHGGMKKDIVGTAVENGSFNSLVAAVQAAGLVETLQGDGPYTVFAPNDAAFAKIPAETLESLLADPEALTGILGLHVIAGKKMSGDVAEIYNAVTITGKMLNISKKGGEIFVNGSKIVAVDVETSNGVIHVIDTVITK